MNRILSYPNPAHMVRFGESCSPWGLTSQISCELLLAVGEDVEDTTVLACLDDDPSRAFARDSPANTLICAPIR